MSEEHDYNKCILLMVFQMETKKCEIIHSIKIEIKINHYSYSLSNTNFILNIKRFMPIYHLKKDIQIINMYKLKVNQINNR